jgi:hypothetical protein
MSNHWITRVRDAACVALALLAVGLPGCGRGGFTSELPVQPQAQIVRATEGTTLSLPQDKPLAIALAPTQETPGLDGTADADAHATKDGNADARAAVKNAGTATGGFQLGHALKNETERQVDFDFHVRFRYEYEAKAEPASGLPDATVALTLYGRTGRGRRLTELDLLQHSTGDGAVQRAADEDLHFTLTLGPGETVNVYLGGEVKVEVADGHSASGSLKVSALKMDIVTRPAPPVATTQNAKP